MITERHGVLIEALDIKFPPKSRVLMVIIGGIATLVLFFLVVMLLLRTGGVEAVSDNAAVIGALVALGGVFTAQMVSIALDDRRTKEARDLERQRARDDASRKLSAP